MGWQTQIAVQIQAGNTIINPDGIFTYSGTPAAGNLIFSSAPAAGTDSFGNAYVEGASAYITTGGSTFALQLGNQGTNGAAFFIHNQTTPPSNDPGFSANLASPSGTAAEIVSGKATAGSTQAVLIVSDSTLSGTPGGEVDISAGLTTFSGSVTITGTASINGSNNTASNGLTDGTINGSSSNAGLTNGTINGTSGAASAGTAHTHGGGSYAVTNGQHNHSPGSYAVTDGNHNHVL
jgi:hypothetical protein